MTDGCALWSVRQGGEWSGETYNGQDSLNDGSSRGIGSLDVVAFSSGNCCCSAQISLQ